jgi:hypothetical protein
VAHPFSIRHHGSVRSAAMNVGSVPRQRLCSPIDNRALFRYTRKLRMLFTMNAVYALV